MVVVSALSYPAGGYHRVSTSWSRLGLGHGAKTFYFRITCVHLVRVILCHRQDKPSKQGPTMGEYLANRFLSNLRRNLKMGGVSMRGESCCCSYCCQGSLCKSAWHGLKYVAGPHHHYVLFILLYCSHCTGYCIAPHIGCTYIFPIFMMIYD